MEFGIAVRHAGWAGVSVDVPSAQHGRHLELVEVFYTAMVFLGLASRRVAGHDPETRRYSSYLSAYD